MFRCKRCRRFNSADGIARVGGDRAGGVDTLLDSGGFRGDRGISGAGVGGTGGSVPLSALENVLQAWLREQLPLPEDVGEISFDSPDGTWGTAVTRPTVNLFLFEIARAAQQPVALPPRRDPDGTLVREQPAPAVSFSYLLSAWGGGAREEHRLLGDAVRAVLRTPFLTAGAEDGPASSELAGPVQLALAAPDQVRARDLWTGLGGRLRASMVLVATTAVSLERPQRLAAPVQRVETTVRKGGPAHRSQDALVPAQASASGAGSGSGGEPAPSRRFVFFGSSRQRERGQD
jgi:hypothetical protein